RKRPALIYSFIHDHRFKLRVAKMCSVFQVSRSGYYEWTRRKKSNRAKRQEQMDKQSRRIFLDSRRLTNLLTEVQRKQWHICWTVRFTKRGASD
ncbi:hypothetical protein LQV63_28955, partial [Paenibacillus profundus]|nr:hypothetical protein [Paenibacillus profundus]